MPPLDVKSCGYWAYVAWIKTLLVLIPSVTVMIQLRPLPSSRMIPLMIPIYPLPLVSRNPAYLPEAIARKRLFRSFMVFSLCLGFDHNRDENNFPHRSNLRRQERIGMAHIVTSHRTHILIISIYHNHNRKLHHLVSLFPMLLVYHHSQTLSIANSSTT